MDAVEPMPTDTPADAARSEKVQAPPADTPAGAARAEKIQAPPVGYARTYVVIGITTCLALAAAGAWLLLRRRSRGGTS